MPTLHKEETSQAGLLASLGVCNPSLISQLSLEDVLAVAEGSSEIAMPGTSRRSTIVALRLAGRLREGDPKFA